MCKADERFIFITYLRLWIYAHGLGHFQMLIKLNTENKSDQISKLPLCYILSTD